MPWDAAQWIISWFSVTDGASVVAAVTDPGKIVEMSLRCLASVCRGWGVDFPTGGPEPAMMDRARSDAVAKTVCSKTVEVGSRYVQGGTFISVIPDGWAGRSWESDEKPALESHASPMEV